MKKKFLILIIFVTFSFSQSLLGFRYPTGISYPLSTASARIAGAGAAIKEPYFVGSLNPGNLGAINQSVYSLAVNGNYTRVYEYDDYADFSSFSPTFIGFAFPMRKAGTIGVSFKQNGSNKYSYSENSLLINSTKDTVPIMQTITFENYTTFSAWEFGWGIELFKKISIGATYQIGQYKNRFCRSNVFRDANVFSDVDSIYYDQLNSTIRGGVLGQFGKLGLGLSVTCPVAADLNFHRTIKRLQYVSGDYNETSAHDKAVFDTTYQTHFPASGIFGVSWIFSEKLKLAADASMTFWNTYKTDAWQLSDETNLLSNAFAICAGTEFIPQPNLLSPRYFQKVRYSGGLAFRQLPIKGDMESSVSLGMGLPLGSKGILDFSVETGIRRSDIEKNIRENFVRINFGMSGGQQWKKTNNNVY